MMGTAQGGATPFLVADLFCGAGGSSTGAKKAIEEIGGHMELVAVNHWNTAIATHSANHPTARHLVEDVSMVDPEAVVEEGRLDLLMASPECKFYSRARGGKPVHDQGRMNPWVVHNWLTKLDVRCVIIENVPEFTVWGPLDANGKPDKARKGMHFEAWFLAFHSLGYEAEWRMLNAADYGDATTRVRFFLMARKDGKPLEWPDPSHAQGDTGMFPGRRRWRGASEIIDWSNVGRSLFDDPKYQKKPLSEKTRRRIARGLDRFGGPLAPLYIRLLGLSDYEASQESGRQEPQPFILNRHGENGSDRTHSVEDPVPTATCRGAGYLVEAGAEPFVQANRNENAPKSLEDPVPVVTTAHGGGSFLVEPVLQSFLLGQQSGGAPRSTEDPAPTVTADGAISLVQPSIIQYYGTSDAHGIDRPLSSVTAGGRKHGLVRPTLVEYYGNSDAADVDDPLPTVTAKARHGLANPTLVQLNHGNGHMGDKGNERRVHSVDDPVPGITTSPGLGIATPALLQVNHGNGTEGDTADDRRVHSVEDPLPTMTTKRNLGLANPVLVRTGHTLSQSIAARPVEDPMPTLVTKNDLTLVNPQAKPYIVPNFGEAEGQEPRTHDIEDPLPAVTSRGAGNLVTPTLQEAMLEHLEQSGIDPRRMVFVDGQPYLLDIRFRMLQNPELARAMGFEDEETRYEFVGTVADVTKQIGNAVPVNLAAALVKSALGQR